MASANRRLLALQRTLAGPASWRRVVLLPDGARVDVLQPHDAAQPTHVAVDGQLVGLFRTLPRSLALVISAIGTPHEHTADHIPKYPVLELLPPAALGAAAGPATITPPDLWAIVYALFTLFDTHENIPLVLGAGLENAPALSAYLLTSGLARKRHTTRAEDAARAAAEPEHFLLRDTFWQGAGTAPHHARGWLRGHAARLALAPPPYTQSFTRTPLVVAAHPLRPPKPAPGELLYRRYVPSLGQTLEFVYLDVEGGADVVECEGETVSRQLATFHRWHNSDHVNRGWGERGSLEKHREYMRAVMADPGVLPVMMCWDGELMGYAELVYIKENHVAPYIPGGAWEYDRGLHILVGEEKYRGIHRSKAWISAIHHFLFLSDPRTERVIGEPKAVNEAVIKLSLAVEMNLNTKFDFPYKRSVMTWLPRERFFKYNHLAFAEDRDTPAEKEKQK
ncbi:acyl-CoA N-acyltransferase [Lenzites betulinus]|nr:acyl-CoA N-acyltransferase [Lenzites betulinus]